MNTKRTLVILAESNIIKERLTETAWGPFKSIPEASSLGKEKIKSLRWRVAYRVERERKNEPDEVTYEFVGGLNEPERRAVNFAA
jgi:hypothetical protein